MSGSQGYKSHKWIRKESKAVMSCENTAALQQGWCSLPGQTSSQTLTVPLIRRRWGKGRNASQMNSGVTTSLREARVTREDSHPLLHEKHSKKDVSVDICQSVANISMSILSVIVYSPVVVVQSCPTLWHHGLQHTRLPCPSLYPRVCTNSWHHHLSVMPSNHLILCHPLLLLISISQHQGLFQWVSSLHQVAKVLAFQLQYQSFQWIFRVDFL